MSTSKCQISQRLCYFGTFYLHKRNSTCHWSVTGIVPTDLVLVPPPIPTALQLPGNTHLRLRHFPAPTQQSELIAPTHKKKITRRAATRFRSVLVYLRLVSLKIVPPLFFLTEAAWSCTEQWRKSDTGAAPRIRPLLYVQTSSITPYVKPCKDGTKRRDF